VAEDVAQEVFLQLHRRHAADASYAAAWLHAAAAPVGSSAAEPSSTLTIFPSPSTTNVARFAIPIDGISTPYSFDTSRM